MMTRCVGCLLVVSVTLLGGCASAPPPGATAPAEEAPPAATPAAAGVAERLRDVLSVEIPGRAERARIAAIEEDLGSPVEPLVAAIARDPSASVVQRVNALILLGDRRAEGQIETFARGLDAAEPPVRAAAAVALRGLVGAPAGEVPARARALLRRALEDPAPLVRAKALETLADSDVGILRQFLTVERSPELRRLAEELVRVAMARGAPIGEDVPVTEPLRRESPSGVEILFRPERGWERWRAAVGEVLVTPPSGEPQRLSGDVEVVGGVIPVFVSPDGRYAVYEADRAIRVRDLVAGTEREVGPGIAPRLIPFTQDLVFLREQPEARSVERESVAIAYGVWRAGLEAGVPDQIGALQATARPAVHGNYSPVRWMRVQERNGRFVLTGEDISPFELPDPFASR